MAFFSLINDFGALNLVNFLHMWTNANIAHIKCSSYPNSKPSLLQLSLYRHILTVTSKFPLVLIAWSNFNRCSDREQARDYQLGHWCAARWAFQSKENVWIHIKFSSGSHAFLDPRGKFLASELFQQLRVVPSDAGYVLRQSETCSGGLDTTQVEEFGSWRHIQRIRST